jgi:phenylpropionate dioxygenase-like ring-hydroxylating dioxygenase large terminal subunit
MHARNGTDYRALIHLDHGTVDRRIFFADDIYETELERIFARAWNFMCHESQIPNPGDFFLNFIGEENVIATRDRQGRLQVLLNTCRHRAMRCAAPNSGTCARSCALITAGPTISKAD